MKFRRKQQVIEAFQMTREARQDNSDWPAWLGEAWQKERGEIGALWPREYPDSDGTDELLLQEGSSVQGVIAFGTWIINDNGALRSMPNRYFIELYEAVMPADEEDRLTAETRAEMRGFWDAIIKLIEITETARADENGFSPADLETLWNAGAALYGEDAWNAFDAELLEEVSPGCERH
jgi:hypothetical protein